MMAYRIWCERCGAGSSDQLPASRFALYAVERMSGAPLIVKLCPPCDRVVQTGSVRTRPTERRRR